MIDDDDNYVDDNADADVDADKNEEIPASTTTFSLVKSDLGSIIISIFSTNCQVIRIFTHIAVVVSFTYVLLLFCARSPDLINRLLPIQSIHS